MMFPILNGIIEKIEKLKKWARTPIVLATGIFFFFFKNQ